MPEDKPDVDTLSSIYILRPFIELMLCSMSLGPMREGREPISCFLNTKASPIEHSDHPARFYQSLSYRTF